MSNQLTEARREEADAGSGRLRLRLPSALVAAAFYLTVALWSMRAVLPAPSSTFPALTDRLTPRWQQLLASDQKLTAWGISRNARTLLTSPWRMLEAEQCYPLPRSITLGEHMFGEGLLGTIPYLISRNPILTYNITAVLTLWLGAMSMYALVYYWTKSAGAAFVAGLLSGFHPIRVGDLVHLHVIDNGWMPLCFLFADRLFASRRWRDALALTAFLSLQTLSSFYNVLTLATIGSVYAAYLLCRNWRSLPALAPKLLLPLAALALLGSVLFLPYLETKELWSTLARQQPGLLNLSDLARGGSSYPGSVLLLLGSVALLDRLRGPRRLRGYDPRLVYFLAGLCAIWASVSFIPIPTTGIKIPSLYILASGWIPGLEAVRAGGVVRAGAYLAGAFLAGWGLFVLTARCSQLSRSLILLLFSATALAEVFLPVLARGSFRRSLETRPHLVRPAPGLVELYKKQPPGPVLDLPFSFDKQGFIPWMPHYVFLSAFHHQPVAACYNSFFTPVQREIESIAARLPDSAAADALYALGFRTIVLHHELLTRGGHLLGLQYLPSAKTHLLKAGQAVLHTAFRIQHHGTVTENLSVLKLVQAEGEKMAVAVLPEAEIGFRFYNKSKATFRHPLPLKPTPLAVTWQDRTGLVVRRDEFSMLLPLALGPKETTVRGITVALPERPGIYAATLAPVTEPELVLARVEVRVINSIVRKRGSR